MDREETAWSGSDRALRDAALDYALWYLSRYGSASRQRLVQKLTAKLVRLECDPSLIDDIAVEIAAQLEQQGLINDVQAAQSRARKLIDRGWSPGSISRDLWARGIGKHDAEAALEQLDNPELNAAIRLAQRKGLGPWRRKPVTTDLDTARQKEYRQFAIRGFAFKTARRILEANNPEDVMR